MKSRRASSAPPTPSITAPSASRHCVHISRRVTAALLLGCLASAGMADAAEGHVTHGRLSWTLIDLDTSDGIAPSLEFLPLPQSPTSPLGAARAYVWYVANGASDEANVPAADTFPLVASFNASPYAAVTGRIDGRTAPATELITLNTLATLGGGSGSQAFGWLQGDALQFVLSPNTEVRFQSAVRVQASIDVRWDVDEFYQATSSLLLDMDGTLPGGDVTDFTTVTASPSPGDPYAIDVRRLLSVSFANRGPDSLSGDVAMRTVAVASSAQPVPEPATLPMTLAGLAVVGWAARRRGRA